MGHSVFIDGQAGTTGIGIAARLAEVRGITLVELADVDRKSAAARQAAMRQADLVILCLPDDAARESVALAEQLGQQAPKLLDASTAHRVAEGWVYGFAELAPEQGERIATASRVANPGCYATGAIALLKPLLAGGLLPADMPLSINAVSGYSGGGHAMIAAHEHDAGPAYELYALGLDHKHLPEIAAHAGLSRRPVFLPSVAHLRQGMLVCIPLHLDLLGGVTVMQMQAALAAYYPVVGQVRVVPSDPTGRIDLGGMNGSDMIELSVQGNAGQAVLVARLDNLGKGASGAAVQNARLMLGLA